MDVDVELELKIYRRGLQVLLRHEFRLGRKATEATYVARWERMYPLSVQHNIGFIGLKNGNFEIDDLSHFGSPLQMDVDLLKQLIEEDPRMTSRCLVE